MQAATFIARPAVPFLVLTRLLFIGDAWDLTDGRLPAISASLIDISGKLRVLP
jgi:hypothetical protein